MGICFSPLISSQEAASSSILNRWLQICNCAAVWSGGKLKFIPYGDTAIGEGDQQTLTRNFSIPYVVPPDSGTGYYLPAQISVASPDEFVSDGGVVYASNGFPLIDVGPFVISPTNFTPAPGRLRDEPARELHLLQPRRGRASHHDLHGQGDDRLCAAVDAALRSHRRRLSVREGHRSGHGRAGRPVLAAVDPARSKSPAAPTPMR